LSLVRETMSSARWRSLGVILLCCTVLLQFGFMSPGNAEGRHQPVLNSAPISSGTNSAPFDYVVVIVMENQGVCDIAPSLACGSTRVGNATYMTSLAASNGLTENYTAITHPSLPNYLALLSGQDWGCKGFDVGPKSNPCTDAAWNSTNANLVDRLEASGLTWKAYMENMPSNCDTSDSGLYAARHDPFVYFKDIVNDTSRCYRVVPAGTNDTGLLSDLSATSSASNLMWLTPNLCNDMHDDCTTNSTTHVECGSGGNVTNCIIQGDTYLSQIVPKILSSYVFTTQKAALFLTFDEGNGYCPLDGSSRDCIYTVWAGPVAKKNYVSSASYSHYSFLATLEASWNLVPLTLNDTSAPPMSEFFTTLFPLRVTTSTSSPEAGEPVAFTATTGGGTAPYSFSWDFGDSTVGTGGLTNHTYTSPGNYLVRVKASDTKGATIASNQTIIVTSGPELTFSVNPAAPVVGQPVTLSAVATAGKAPFVFSWDLGDNTHSSSNPISHTYTSSGQFNIHVNITDALGVTSSDTTVLTVALRSTNTSISCPSTRIVNVPLQCSINVTDVGAGPTSVLSGIATFTSNSTGTFSSPSCTLSAGSCSVTYTPTFAGHHLLTGTYSGDSVHTGSSGTFTLASTIRSSSTRASCSPSSVNTGVSTTCTAMVTDLSGTGAVTPTGTITFTTNSTVAFKSTTCTLVSGSCSVNIVPSIAGLLSVSAGYVSSDSIHSASSASVSIVVTSTPSGTSNQPVSGPCFFSLCYSAFTWELVIIVAVVAATTLTVLVFRGRMRRTKQSRSAN
jgi:phosphatidylinositol-3-phosphatase